MFQKWADNKSISRIEIVCERNYHYFLNKGIYNSSLEEIEIKAAQLLYGGTELLMTINENLVIMNIING